MATIVLACGCECGVGGGVSSHFPTSTGTGTGEFVTATKRGGLRSLHFLTTSAQRAYFRQDGVLTLGTRIFVVSFYLRFTSLPAEDTGIWFASDAGETAYIGVGFNAATGKIECYQGTSTTVYTFAGGGVTPTLGLWYRVDARVNTTANPWTCDAQINGTALTQSTRASAAANPAIIGIGLNPMDNAGAAEIHVDDIIYSQTSGDYPLGAHYIVSYIPNADGTHNVAGANDFEYSGTGVDITNASTDVYTLVDDRPLETTLTDYINLVAPPNATDYVECLFGNETEGAAPLAVETIMAVQSAGTLANNLRVALVDKNGSTQADVLNGDISETSLFYKRAISTVIPGGGAWTEVAFNALAFRAYTNDASPDPYLASIMLEAVFAGDPNFGAWIPQESSIPTRNPVPIIAY